MAALAIAAVFAIAALMLKSWLNHRETMTGLSLSKRGLAPSDERLARVEQAVEAIAIEVERISEGQRFVTKLLSERAQLEAGRIQGTTPSAPPTTAR